VHEIDRQEQPMVTVKALAAVSLILIAGCSSTPQPPPALDFSSYRAIAVLPFQTEGFLERYGAEVADQIIIAILDRDPRFPVVERAEVDQVLRERALNAEKPRADTGSPLIPADLIVTGSVAFAVENVDRPGPLRQARLTATVRAFETGSGRIVWAGRFLGSGEDLLSYQTDGTSYRYQSDAEIREQAIQKLAEEIVQGLLGKRQEASE
jgi:TolB-like protein